MNPSQSAVLPCLFEYNAACNRKLFEVIRQHEKRISEKSVQLLSHIVNAHQIWNSRILKREAVGVWDVRALESLSTQDEENHETTSLILSEKPVSEHVEYTNTKGNRYTNTVFEILFHVINHSTYHRAQIAADFRACGLEPVVTDYIMYSRSG